NRAADALGTAFGGLLGATLVVGEIAVLGLAGMLAARGEIPVGDVVVYQILFLTAMHSIQGIVSLLPEAAALRESVASLCEVLEHPAPARTGRMVKIRSIASVEFRNVSFSYPSARRPAIRNFSETFTPGQAVALLGANGAGKTTLLKLAAGALEPPTGEILVNGTPAHWIDMDSFRRRIGVVFQDNLLVSGTIIDNITLRDPALKKADVYAAAAASGLDEVVSHLPDGLDTRVGVGGQSLSGGECQRLAIARALVRKPDLLVLDEATNHLDAETRASFAKLLRQLVKDRIVLVVTHDSAIADLCDKKISCQIPEDPSYTIM
ncbi:MAG: ATP-binding cassette domain-containing protein, partial [Kiritimatiellae bacterium]|nr:ATP-binding cassette domain-containing protein [Kiritimatiellia bacterium]